MATAQIELPDDVRALAQEQAERAGHSSIGEYVQALIRADTDRLVDAELERELLRGLDSPAREMTSADWDEKRRRLAARHGEQGGR